MPGLKFPSCIRYTEFVACAQATVGLISSTRYEANNNWAWTWREKVTKNCTARISAYWSQVSFYACEKCRGTSFSIPSGWRTPFRRGWLPIKYWAGRNVFSFLAQYSVVVLGQGGKFTWSASNNMGDCCHTWHTGRRMQTICTVYLRKLLRCLVTGSDGIILAWDVSLAACAHIQLMQKDL